MVMLHELGKVLCICQMLENSLRLPSTSFQLVLETKSQVICIMSQDRASILDEFLNEIDQRSRIYGTIKDALMSTTTKTDHAEAAMKQTHRDAVITTVVLWEEFVLKVLEEALKKITDQMKTEGLEIAITKNPAKKKLLLKALNQYKLEQTYTVEEVENLWEHALDKYADIGDQEIHPCSHTYLENSIPFSTLMIKIFIVCKKRYMN